MRTSVPSIDIYVTSTIEHKIKKLIVLSSSHFRRSAVLYSGHALLDCPRWWTVAVVGDALQESGRHLIPAPRPG
jgi:hypothetical protein